MQTSYLLLATFAGALLPIQAGINAKLLDPLNNSIAPAFVSFFGGSIVLSLFFFMRRETNDNKTSLTFDKPSAILNWSTWSLLKSAPLYLIVIPGLFGAIYVAFAAFLGDKIGFTLFFVALIAGQILSSITADAIGFLGLQKKPATTLRNLSMILVLGGSVISVSDNLSSSVDETDVTTGELVLYMVLSCLAGLPFGIQPPMNAKLQRHMQSHAHRLTWWSFVNGALWLLLFTALSVPITDEPIGFENIPDIEVWKFFGGPLGALFVFSSIFLAPRIGLGAFVVAGVAGQLISSLVVDTFGLLQSAEVEVTAARVTGVVVVYIGVLVFRLEEQILGLCKPSSESQLERHAVEVKSEKTDAII